MSRWPGRLITKTPVTPGGSSPTASAPGVWTLPEMAYWKKQGLWPDPSADAYWGYVSYLMATSSLSNANNNLFVDSSGAFNPVIRSGNTTQGAVTPYGTLWSNYFDGSSYITMASGIAAGTGDFTIEGWFNVSSYSTGPGLYDTRPSFTNGAYPAVFVDASGYLTYYVNTAVQIQGATLVGLNTWNHFAVCRSGTSTRLFLNGVQQGSTYTDTNNYQMGGSRPIIGGNGYYPNGASQLTGYISNIRVVNGTALYTSTFTPPTTPLTAIGGTVLLTCQGNRFLDASTNNVAVSVTGAARVTPYSPFVLNSPGAVYNQSDISYWSGYFNGSSYLSAPDSSGYALNSSGWSFETFVNFTSLPGSGGAASLAAQWYDGDLGWWFYLYNNAGTYQLYFSYSTNGSNQINISVNLSAAPQLNTWNHIAYLYLSGIGVGIFWNGVQIGTFQSFGGTVFNSSSAMQIGARVGSAGAGYYLNGYLSNMRLVNAPGGSYIWPPTSPITAISGTTLLTLQSAAFTDNSTTNAVFTPVGNPLVTGNNPFQAGYYSNYFDGSGDYLTAPTNAVFGYGTGDFTIEFWMYLTGTPDQTIFSNLTSASSTNPHIYYSAGTIRYYTASADRITSSTIAPNRWHHVALSRASGSTKMFVNGVQAGSTYADSNNYGTTAPLGLATYWSGGSPVTTNTFTGYLSNVRVVKGTAVYTSAFTPPTVPLTEISGTSVLTCQANRLIDSSTNALTLTKAGDTSVASFDPFYTATPASNGGSMYFDGNGDYLSLAGSPLFSIATSTTPFTVEGWLYPTAAGGVIFNEAYTGPGTTISIAITMSTNANSMDPTGGRYVSFGAYNGSFWTTAAYSSSQIQLNTWTHVACVFTGSTTKIFFNGVDVTAGTPATTWPVTGVAGDGWYVGRRWDTYADVYFSGYISDFRFTNGTAVYTSAFTPPTAPLTPSGNTVLLLNGMNAGTYDAAMQQNMETVGNAQVSSAQAKYGTTSVSFDGVGDQLLGQTNLNLAFGTGDFTIEAWVYQTQRNTLSDITSCHNYGVGADWLWSINSSGNLFFQISSSGTGSQTSSSTVPLNTWTHVAVSRRNGVVKQFIAGTEVSSATYATSVANTIRLSVGSSANLNANSTFYGYIDDLRITNGYARYTANFTPPTAALPVY